MRLHVNQKGIINEFINVFYNELSFASIAFKNDIESNLGNLGKKHGVNEIELKRINNLFRITLKVNKAFLADNYGTGTAMSTSVSKLSKFIFDDWNPVRPRRVGAPIMGRPAGKYKNLEGKEVTSSGSMAGRNIEHRIFRQKHGGWIEIVPIKPSHAFEWALNWYKSDYLPNAVKRAMKKINISKYLTYK